VWYLGWTKWHWDKLFSAFWGRTLSVIICQYSILIHVLVTLCNLWNQQYRDITQIDNIRIGDDIHAYWIFDLSEELTTKLVVANGREKVTESTF